MALAYSYRRVSSGGQAQGEKSGLQRQEQALKDWMRRYADFRLAEELLDPGISAYTGRNRWYQTSSHLLPAYVVMDEFGGQQKLACAKASLGDSFRQKLVTSRPPFGGSFS